MTYSEIVEKVNEFLVDEFEVEPEVIKPERNLRDTLELDSLDYVDMVVVIESTFGFKVQTEDFKTIATFEDFYQYIANRVGESELK